MVLQVGRSHEAARFYHTAWGRCGDVAACGEGTAANRGLRATNECFLAAFILTESGRAQAVYLSGERDNAAAWTLDGGTLRITSQAFPLDRFTGHLTNDHVEADYVWHDLKKDELNRQTCIFERFTPFRTPGGVART